MTGVINTWNLVGSVGALFGTGYGRLLMVKVALFLMMLGIATVNRLQLSPRLEVDGTTRKLERNSLIEAGLGGHCSIDCRRVGNTSTCYPRLCGAHALNSGNSSRSSTNNWVTSTRPLRCADGFFEFIRSELNMVLTAASDPKRKSVSHAPLRF